MKLIFDQHLSASPETVWHYITEPKFINCWSTALVETLDLGDAGEPGTVGATRQVTIRTPAGNTCIQEVIEHSHPPTHFVYQVFQGQLIKYHRGEIKLVQQDEGTLLRWEVEYEFILPGLAEYARLIIKPQLDQSLASLSNLIKHAPVASFNPSTEIDDSEELPHLWQEAEQILIEQRAMADRLEKEGDPKYWFTRVYEYVTENQIQACREGRITHQAWVLRLISRFHDYYFDNLHCWMGEAPGCIEAHWRSAFQAMECGKYQGGDPITFAHGLIKGIEAHIEEDLPRALAEIYLKHYASRCCYVRLRADYILMANIFHRVCNRLKNELPSNYVPIYLRILNPILPLEIQDAIIAKRFYNIPRQRLLAFERGQRLANLIAAWEKTEII